MKRLLLVAVAACGQTVDANDDPDLDADPDLMAMANDTMPEVAAVDADTTEGADAATVCTKTRYLHIANWSYVGPLACANGVCSNGCWGYQRRTSGFTCDYSAAQADHINTTDGGGPFASYNEIKSLNAHDAAAVASCRAQSGRSVRTYTVWNGAGWNSEGIAAAVQFAEVYGTQSEAESRFWTWYGGSRAGFAPMGNVSPETALDLVGTKALTARLCSATRNGWLGLYYYNSAGGPGMSDWKREAIIRGMNYCTTH